MTTLNLIYKIHFDGFNLAGCMYRKGPHGFFPSPFKPPCGGEKRKVTELHVRCVEGGSSGICQDSDEMRRPEDKESAET